MFNPRNYSAKEIDAALRMKGNSRKISFRYDLLNRNDIRIGTLDGITSATVSYGEFRQICRSATFKMNEYAQKNINFLSDQIQPFFILHMPDGIGTVEFSLGIFLPESPSRSIKGGVSNREIGTYDKTIIIEQDKFTKRHFIEAGTNYVAAITRILNEAGITKINIAESPYELSADREYPIGMKKHEVVNDLLKAINFTSIRVDEMGFMRSEPYVVPSLRQITHTYNANKDSIVHPEFTEELDIAGRANVFTRVAINIESDKELVSTFINDDIRSPISTVGRGRQIVDFEEISNISNQDALDGFVRRIAIESTSAYSKLSFGTALMPTHGSAETLLCIFPDIFDAPQKFSETSWEMPLRFDGVMSHEARKVVFIDGK